MNLFDGHDVASRLVVRVDGAPCRLLHVAGELWARAIDVTTFADPGPTYVPALSRLRLTVEVAVGEPPAEAEDRAALAAPGQRAVKVPR